MTVYDRLYHLEFKHKTPLCVSPAHFPRSKLHKALCMGLTLSSLSIISPAVFADNATNDETSINLPGLSITDSTLNTDMPYAGGQVSTASRVGLLGDKDVMDTPFSTVTYTEAFIENQQATDIQEIISKTDPSVFTSGISGESLESYSIRGLSSNVGDVTVNGLAGMAGYYRSSPEMFEQVEVLKGPSALLNGMPPKGSAGGSVNLVTKRAGDEPLTRITTSYQSDSQFGGHLDVGRRFGEDNQFGIRFNGKYSDGDTAMDDQEKTAQQYALGLDWRGERARLSADIFQSQDQVNGLTRGLSLASDLTELPKVPSSDSAFNPPWSFYDTKDKGAIFRGEIDLNDQLTAYATAGISKTQIDTNMGTPTLLNSSGDFSINYSGVSDEMERKSGEIGLKGAFETGSINHLFAINATRYTEDYELRGFRNLLTDAWVTNIYNPVWSAEAERPYPAPSITKTKTRLTSVGIADTLSFAEDRVQLTLGARRQEVINESFLSATGTRIGNQYKESATTPAAAIVFKATDNLSLYANYIEGLSQGGTAPTTAENAGEVFAPYKTKQKEMGVKLDRGEFTHTLSVYEIKRPSSYTDPVTNIYSFGGEQRNRGVEWGFFGTPLEDIRLMGGIAYSDAEITKATDATTEGKQATGLPKWQAKLGTEWDVPFQQGLTLTANATAASKQYLNSDNSLSIPGRTLLDVGARYTTQSYGYPLTLRATVTNLTNKAYWAKPNYSSLAQGTPRTFKLSATVDF
ncbi:TonB-dependent receptor [Neptunomonas phycophila]|uniref:TonB-dependent receptor n=1 Tax=Neptunomonas phycophila TaxID=1572645 RepID=UPI0009F9643E|nr:TonB-dependent siderophore receptor [Neptunomonas phycophila]